MSKLGKLIILTVSCIVLLSLTVLADGTFSSNWVQQSDGSWKVKDKQNNDIADAWVCDDAVAANGKNVWYLLDKNGNMVSAGLVQDGTGNYYSLETNHNGYYGMLRYQPGTYDGIYLDLESDHNGSFAAIKNKDAIQKLKDKYGLTVVDIDNYNIVYTSDNILSAVASEGWVKYSNGDSYYYKDGEALKGWNLIDGKYYYFDPSSGILAVSCYTPDGYYVDSNGIWNGKAAKTSAEQNSVSAVSEESSDSSDSEGSDKEYEEEPLIWDTASKTNLIKFATKAASSFNEANTLIAEAQKITDRNTAVKKYYKAFGKAAGALEQMNYMLSVIEERPALNLSDGTSSLDSLKTAIKNIESFDTFVIEDNIVFTSAAFKNKLKKITDAAEINNKILTAANNIDAVAITR